MNYSAVAGFSAAGLIIVRLAAQLALERLNRRHVIAQSGAVPEAFRNVVDSSTYAKSIRYTLSKIRVNELDATFNAILLFGVLYSGVLPRVESFFTARFGGSAWAMASFLFAIGLFLGLADLPLSWHAQFGVEARFGFNTTTKRLWWKDRFRIFLLALGLGYPLLVLLLKIVEWTGSSWWLWAWVCLLGVQLLMIVIAPTLILPLFNRLTRLPDGTLRERLLSLAARTAFPAKSVQVMDGSKRSRHSNAFFTGFGRSRRIVLFDTLLEQLTEPELEAVLAHEIGHWKKRHVARMFFWSAAALLAGLYLVSWLVGQEWFFQAFRFPSGHPAAALLLFTLLSGLVTFWLSPLHHFWSRRYEYEADTYAAETLREVGSLIGALRKLNEKNLSNLTPHPLYSRFYYSHPALLERETALRKCSV